MNSTALFTLASSLHSEIIEDASKEKFIRDIEAEAGYGFLFYGDDFSSYGTHDTDIIYVRTGGTEGLFKALDIKGDVKLLTSGDSNSLAASMEILSYLRRKGQTGEIIHGSPSYIVSRLQAPVTGGSETLSPFVGPVPEVDLGGVRLGVIGRPSDWLISSDVDYDKVRTRLNAVLVDIPIQELLDEINLPPERMKTFEGSEEIYRAIKAIISRYRLGGLTLRCFDLLDSVHNTGCLALARLNAEGIPSGCEGDIPALLTMAWLQAEEGCPGFQCNLSRIDGSSLLFAHCSVPLTMLDSYRYDTHFESGIGTAVKGEMILSDVEIVKFSPDLESCVRIPGRIVSNCSFPNLCRTQILVDAPGAAEYFLRSPLANHHVIHFCARR